MNNPLILCLLVGIFWSIAALLGRYSSVSGMMMAVLISIGNLIAVLPVAFSQNYLAVSPRSLLIGLVAGIANGIGILAFYRLVSGSNEGLWEISKMLPISFILVPIGVTVGARVFFGEAITIEKTIGLALACGAIWFLK